MISGRRSRQFLGSQKDNKYREYPYKPNWRRNFIQMVSRGENKEKEEQGGEKIDSFFKSAHLPHRNQNSILNTAKVLTKVIQEDDITIVI